MHRTALAGVVAAMVVGAVSSGAAVDRPTGMIAFAADGPGCCGGIQVFVADLDQGRIRRLTTNGGWHPSFSPDGFEVAFQRTSDGPCNSPYCTRIWRTDLLGLPPDPVTPRDRRCESPAWSPTGAVIAYVQWEPSRRLSIRTNIYTRTPNGGGARRLTRGDTQDSDPLWSPDGKRIAFLRQGRARRSALWVMNADGSKQRRLRWLKGATGLTGWSPDGKRLLIWRAYGAFNNHALVAVITLGRRGERVLARNASDAAWSRDGRFVAFVPDNQELDRGYVAVVRSDGTGRRTLFRGRFNEPYGLAWHALRREAA